MTDQTKTPAEMDDAELADLIEGWVWPTVGIKGFVSEAARRLRERGAPVDEAGTGIVKCKVFTYPFADGHRYIVEGTGNIDGNWHHEVYEYRSYDEHQKEGEMRTVAIRVPLPTQDATAEVEGTVECP